MKIILLTPGTGSYHCGVCLRDNALARELIRQGHDAIMLPMYLPLTLDEPPVNPGIPIFFGGISVYLEQKIPFLRRMPRWLDRLLSARWLLRLVAGSAASQTGGADAGELTHSMLLGEEGRQAGELEHLIAWLREHGKADAIWLSTALLTGLARRLKSALGAPVIASLQGEDSFLDGLAEPWKTRCWETLSGRSRDVDAFIAPTRYYADFMGGRMKLPPAQVRVIPNGIAAGDYEVRTAPPQPPVIGFLSRMIPGKGLGTVIDAFILLKKRGHFPETKLRIAGAMTDGDRPYVEQLKARLRGAGCDADTDFSANVSRGEKIAFLRELTLLSVPASYGEAFGLYLAEAWAAGVPVVQPRCAAFPEMIEATGAGRLFEPSNTGALVEEWEWMLAHPDEAAAMGRRGRAAAEGEFSLATMAGRFMEVTRGVIAPA